MSANWVRHLASEERVDFMGVLKFLKTQRDTHKIIEDTHELSANWARHLVSEERVDFMGVPKFFLRVRLSFYCLICL